MTTTTTTITKPAAEPRPQGKALAAPEQGVWDIVKRVLKPIASLKLTVALFAMSIFLTYAGTAAQIRSGIWSVVDEYFRTAIAAIPIETIFLYAWDMPDSWVIYFPGGWLIGTVLLLNLLSAHAIRFTCKARGRDLTLGLAVLAVGIFMTWLVLAGYMQSEVAATTGDAFWRVLWRLLQGLIAAVVLYAGCWLLFKKRAGIVLLHGGIILLLCSELITGLWAVESTMTIAEGETTYFIDLDRRAELAIIDTSNPEHDTTVAVPADHEFRSGKRISDEQLPFDIKVEQWMVNSSQPMLMSEVGPPMRAQNKATAGEGRNVLVLPREEGSGVATNQAKDTPAAYVTFYEKGTDKSLGTYLVSMWFYPNFTARQLDIPQTVSAGGTDYTIYLRPEREYLVSDEGREPFGVQLLDFKFERYLGTNTPKDYSSFIRLQDPDRGVDRDLRIWMNNPLRYGGRTFYQSSFLGDESGTILQVVKNVGWMVPYVSCMIVAVGMTAHFGGYLLEFLRKRAAQ